MKKLIIALVALFSIAVSANAMSYDQARQQALFLTDKMAYELNLTDDQYEAAYEINLDYLMGINDYNDIFGTYWQRRNLDLSYILLDWQFDMFRNASYFYRPLYWDGGYWHFGIYARYPHRDYFYFGTPTFYTVYRGGHSWHMNGNRSWYYDRNYNYARQENRMGMRDYYDRQDNRYNRGNVSFGNGPRRSINNYGNNGTGKVYGNQNNQRGGNSQYGPASSNNINFGSRRSSTRTTVTTPNYDNSNRSGNFGNNRNSDQPSTRSSVPNNTFTPSQSNGSRGNSFQNRSMSMPSSSYNSPSRSYSAPSRSYSAPSRSYSAPSRAFSAPSRSSVPSVGTRSGNSGRSNGGGNSKGNGGGHFGGRR